MIPSSILAAVSGLALSATPSPAWQSDYAAVLAQSAAANKPVAVLIGQGDAGKQLPAAAAQAFQSNFICLYADISTPAGRNVAATFRLSEGLVISDRSGKIQALRHNGTVPAADLTKYAERFAAPVSVNQTEHVGVVTADAAPAPVAPVMTAPPVMYAPAPAFQYAPAYRFTTGCGCPNGRCGR